MDIKALRELHRKERTSPSLQDVGKDFYREAEALLEELYTRCEDAKHGDIAKLSAMIAELENVKNTIRDIYELRERKILSDAMYSVKSGGAIEAENLTPEEEELLRSVSTALRESRGKLLAKILAEKTVRVPRKEEQSQLVQKEERQEAAARITVRMLKDLPPIVGVDGRIYGGFKSEDVVSLPEPNARAFINQGAAEEIKLERRV